MQFLAILPKLSSPQVYPILETLVIFMVQQNDIKNIILLGVQLSKKT